MVDFAALRAELAARDPNPRSELDTPTSLATFLLIYSRAEHECYVDYMQGAKDLAEWLAPIEYPDFAFIDDRYKVPSLLKGYSSIQIAEIISKSTLVEGDNSKVIEEKLAKRARAERAVLASMFRQVLPELY